MTDRHDGRDPPAIDDPGLAELATSADRRTRDVVSGSRWGAVTQASVLASRWIVSAVLARHLAPDEFGIVILGLTFVMLLDVFKDMGTVPAIVHRRQVDHLLLTSLFWVNVAVGVTLAGLFALLVPLLRPEERGLLSALGLLLVISSLGLVQQAVIRRNLRFRALAVHQVAQPVVYGAVAVICAVQGLGAWSLVVGQLVGTSVGTAVVWFQTDFRPSFAFRWERVREVMGYSGNMTVYQAFNWSSINGDKVVVGQLLGDASLGLYGFGQRVLYLPVKSVTTPIQNVLFTTFSRVQDDDAVIARGYLRSCAAIAALVSPLMLGFVAVADPFVEIVYGRRWLPAVPVATILAPMGLVQALQTTVGAIYKAKGRPDLLLRWGLVSGTATVAAYLLGTPWGIAGVAAAYAVATVLLSYHSFAIPFRLIGLRVRDLVTVVTEYVGVAAVMGVVVYGVRRWLEAGGAGPGVVLAVTIPVGAVLYGGWMLVRRPPAFSDLTLVVTGRDRGRPTGHYDRPLDDPTP